MMQFLLSLIYKLSATQFNSNATQEPNFGRSYE